LFKNEYFEYFAEKMYYMPPSTKILRQRRSRSTASDRFFRPNVDGSRQQVTFTKLKHDKTDQKLKQKCQKKSQTMANFFK